VGRELVIASSVVHLGRVVLGVDVMVGYDVAAAVGLVDLDVVDFLLRGFTVRASAKNGLGTRFFCHCFPLVQLMDGFVVLADTCLPIQSQSNPNYVRRSPPRTSNPRVRGKQREK
jgi:hypothetical protein